MRGSSNFQRTVDSSYLPKKTNLKELAVFMKEPESKNRWFSAQFVFFFLIVFGRTAVQRYCTKVGCLNSGGPADGCVGGYSLYTRLVTGGYLYIVLCRHQTAHMQICLLLFFSAKNKNKNKNKNNFVWSMTLKTIQNPKFRGFCVKVEKRFYYYCRTETGEFMWTATNPPPKRKKKTS